MNGLEIMNLLQICLSMGSKWSVGRWLPNNLGAFEIFKVPKQRYRVCWKTDSKEERMNIITKEKRRSLNQHIWHIPEGAVKFDKLDSFQNL